MNLTRSLTRSATAGALVAAMLGVAALPAQAAQLVQAQLKNSEGKPVGMAYLQETPHGVLLHVNFNGLPEGSHAFHIHDVGKCEAPSFKSAGGHYAPNGNEHGLLNPKGPHAGDMPNIHILESGNLDIEVMTNVKSMDGLLSGDGTALVVHEGPDDYRTNPAGNAGPRIACGVIEATNTGQSSQ